MKQNASRTLVTPLLFFLFFLFASPLVPAQKAAPATDELKLGSPNVIQPEELAKILQSSSGPRPVVFYVGPPVFYQQAHIRGAEDVGPAARPEGLEKLHSRAAKLAKNSLVVVYCGCCPWTHCPNIRPAYRELRKMGFTHVRALYLATNFGTNWADKGYPVEKGK